MKPWFHALLFAPALIAIDFASAQNEGAASFQAVENDDAIVISHGETTVLTYHKAEIPAPEGVDPLYRRSGFIHPINTPSGKTITGSRPSDHYHHLGLWHAWVRCDWNEQDVDFWNLRAATGRVRYAETLEIMSETEEAGFAVEQEHVAYLGEDKDEKVILKERFEVATRLVDGAYEIDYQFTQTNVTEHPLKFPAYRYGGGIAYRSPFHWDNTNSDYLSSEGKTRIDGHETRSNWCAMFGPAAGTEEIIGLSILCHPDNHDAPQRMRVWPPQDANGTIFFNYVPIQETAWEIKPDETATMQYRIIVQDGKPETDAVQSHWNNYQGDR